MPGAEEIETSVFKDRKAPPENAAVDEALGPSAAAWAALRAGLTAEHGPPTFEWKHYGARSGWTLKTLRGKRNLFFFSPLAGRFRLGFVFGDAAVSAVEASDLPDALKAELAAARKYAEGRGLRLVIDGNDPGAVAVALQLVRIKVAH